MARPELPWPLAAAELGSAGRTNASAPTRAGYGNWEPLAAAELGSAGRTNASAPTRVGYGNWEYALGQSIRQPGNRLHQIVVDDHHGEQHEEDECGLIDAFLDGQADVAAHEPFDQQEHDHSAIENGNGQQVEDAEVQADGGGQLHQRSPALAACGLACRLADADGAF